jgi:hypothetical protein
MHYVRKPEGMPRHECFNVPLKAPTKRVSASPFDYGAHPPEIRTTPALATQEHPEPATRVVLDIQRRPTRRYCGTGSAP